MFILEIQVRFQWIICSQSLVIFYFWNALNHVCKQRERKTNMSKVKNKKWEPQECEVRKITQTFLKRNTCANCRTFFLSRHVFLLC